MLTQGQLLDKVRHLRVKNFSNSYQLLQPQPSIGIRMYSKYLQATSNSIYPLKLSSSAYNVSHSSSSNVSIRSLHSGKDKNSTSYQVPRLFYIQNPFIWASNKMDFRFLRRKWDPTFSEAEFHRGCRQAVAVITQLISKNMFDSLKPMLTKHAMLSVRREVEILWADEVRRNIALKPEEVQLVIPRKVHFRILGRPVVEARRYVSQSGLGYSKLDEKDKKLCDIDMVFIGLKWIENLRVNPQLLFIDIIARFHRNYSDNVVVPEWTVSGFRVRKFNIIPNKQPT